MGWVDGMWGMDQADSHWDQRWLVHILLLFLHPLFSTPSQAPSPQGMNLFIKTRPCLSPTRVNKSSAQRVWWRWQLPMQVCIFQLQWVCDAGGVVVVVVDVVRHPAVISHSLFSSAVIETLQRLQLLHRSAVWHGHCHLQANYANEQFSQIHCRLSLSRRPRCCHLWANLTPTRVVGQIRLSNRIPPTRMRMLMRLKWPLSHLIGLRPDEMIIWWSWCWMSSSGGFWNETEWMNRVEMLWLADGAGRQHHHQNAHKGSPAGDVGDAVAAPDGHMGDKSAARRRALSFQRHVLVQDDAVHWLRHPGWARRPRRRGRRGRRQNALEAHHQRRLLRGRPFRRSPS